MNAKIVFTEVMNEMTLELSTRQVQPEKPNKQLSKRYEELLQTSVNVLFLMIHCTQNAIQMDIMTCYSKKHGFEL